MMRRYWQAAAALARIEGRTRESLVHDAVLGVFAMLVLLIDAGLVLVLAVRP